jgi:hypothetical protein
MRNRLGTLDQSLSPTPGGSEVPLFRRFRLACLQNAEPEFDRIIIIRRQILWAKTEISETKAIVFPAIHKTILYSTIHITNQSAPAQNMCNNAK